MRYYSAWQFGAVHVALSISELNTAEKISKFLNIPIDNVRTTLDFLSRIGLAVYNGRNYTIGSKHIHLGADSAHAKNHHTNWRVKTLQILDQNLKNNFHYSSAVTLSRKDVTAIKEVLIQALKSANKIIQTSKEEEIYSLNFDFYNLRTAQD